MNYDDKMTRDEDMEIDVFDEDDCCQNISCKHNGEWYNMNTKPLKHIDCIISEGILNSVHKLQNDAEERIGDSTEFGGYVKWHWTSRGEVEVDDIIIPKQYVGGVTIDFKSPIVEGYSGVFHKHPSGCTSFSGVDDQYINSNHDISLLFEGGEFIKGIVNIPLPNSKHRLQCNLNIRYIKGGKMLDLNADNINPVKMTHIHKAPYVEVVRQPIEPDGNEGSFNFESFLNSLTKNIKPIINCRRTYK